MAKGLDWQSQEKEKVGRPGESTHNLKILVMGIVIDPTKSRRNGSCVSGKPLLGERVHYGPGLFRH
jgi:hypothetical protein